MVTGEFVLVLFTCNVLQKSLFVQRTLDVLGCPTGTHGVVVSSGVPVLSEKYCKVCGVIDTSLMSQCYYLQNVLNTVKYWYY